MENAINTKIINIAIICHQANKAYCESVGDYSQKDWIEAEQWQRESVINGVVFALTHPDVKPESSHNAWMTQKIADGWVYGEKKDADKKTHPCIVPYGHLPEYQRKKDELFLAIVKALK